MIPVLEVPLGQDLTEFTACLWRSGISHRVVESEHYQVVWLQNPADAETVQHLFARWRAGESLEQVQLKAARRRRFSPAPSLKQLPLTLLLIASSFVVSILIGFGKDLDTLSFFSFAPFSISAGTLRYPSVSDVFASGQLWRLWTPIFMHFSLMHILFNLLWVWLVGGRMEAMQGRLSLLGLVMFSGLLSNLAQFWHTGPVFGGMSGVVFALIAYSWLWDRQKQTPRFGLPPALMGFMLFWVALGYTGMLGSLGFGAIANTAHLVGLLAGLLWLPVGRRLQRGRASL